MVAERLPVSKIEPALAAIGDVVNIEARAIREEIVEVGAFDTFVDVVVENITATRVLLANTVGQEIASHASITLAKCVVNAELVSNFAAATFQHSFGRAG